MVLGMFLADTERAAQWGGAQCSSKRGWLADSSEGWIQGLQKADLALGWKQSGDRNWPGQGSGGAAHERQGTEGKLAWCPVPRPPWVIALWGPGYPWRSAQAPTCGHRAAPLPRGPNVQSASGTLYWPDVLPTPTHSPRQGGPGVAEASVGPGTSAFRVFSAHQDWPRGEGMDSRRLLMPGS